MTITSNTNEPTNAPWYHVDQRGRQIGWMWPDDFKRELESIWGVRKGIAGFSEYSGLNRTTVERYCNGKQPVPKPVALLVQALVLLVPVWREGQTTANKQSKFPRMKAPWLTEDKSSDRFRVATRPFG